MATTGTDTRSLGTRLVQGFVAALVCGVGLAVTVIGLLYLYNPWAATYRLERSVLVCAAVGSAAGFAAYVSRPRRSIAWSMLVVLFGGLIASFPIFAVLEQFSGPKLPSKGEPSPPLPTSLTVGVILSFSVPTLLLIVLRRSQTRSRFRTTHADVMPAPPPDPPDYYFDPPRIC